MRLQVAADMRVEDAGWYLALRDDGVNAVEDGDGVVQPAEDAIERRRRVGQHAKRVKELGRED